MFNEFITKNSEIFVQKMREAFCFAKASQKCKSFSMFFDKIICIFEILTFEILTKRIQTTSLVLNTGSLNNSCPLIVYGNYENIFDT